MPISKSAKKALRSAERKASLNRHRKALIKDVLKNVSSETLPKAFSYIDKGVKWGLMHKNRAARMKSRLAAEIPSVAKEKTAKAAKPKTAAASAKKTTKTAKAKK